MLTRFLFFSLSAFFKGCLAFCAVIFHRLILRSTKTQFGGAFLSQSGARLSYESTVRRCRNGAERERCCLHGCVQAKKCMFRKRPMSVGLSRKRLLKAPEESITEIVKIPYQKYWRSSAGIYTPAKSNISMHWSQIFFRFFRFIRSKHFF